MAFVWNTINLLQKYWQRKIRLSYYRLILELYIEALLLKAIVIALLTWLSPSVNLVVESQSLNLLSAKFILYSNILGPFLETICFQFLPIVSMQIMGIQKLPALAISWCLFATAHIDRGLLGMLPNIVGCLFLTLAYAVGMRREHLIALLISFSLHVLNNATASMLLFAYIKGYL